MNALSTYQRIEIGRLIALIALAGRRQITAVKEGDERARKLWREREQWAVEKLNDEYSIYPQKGYPTEWGDNLPEITS